MRRREFVTLLGGAAVAWPAVADAQQPERMRRIGIMMNSAAADPEPQGHIAVLRQGLQQLGWIEGRNVQFEVRWAGGSAEGYRRQPERRRHCLDSSAGAYKSHCPTATRC